MQSESARARRGFTLTELLIVISIIALLLALLVPALSRARETSRTGQCASNLRQKSAAMEMYANEYRDRYPRALPLVHPELAHLPTSVVEPVRSPWRDPWPSDICPLYWQSTYASMLVPYMGIPVVDPFNYGGLPDQFDSPRTPEPQRKESARLVDFFICPSNQLPGIRDTNSEFRKCGWEIDYGLSNWASFHYDEDRSRESRRRDVHQNRHFLMADMAWGLAYVDGSDTKGLNPEDELDGWWMPFIHHGETLNVVLADYSVVRMDKREFIDRFTGQDVPE